ncbi:MAG: RtcB family protein [Desulfofustis sp.]|nr:RtcB family protein [Desulfofustis sp.]
MIKTLDSEKIPIKLWLDDMEDGALQQAKNIANLPFAFHHVAIMPDAHFGFGMPIGGILAADGVIVPNAVGVDIGCGMCAVKTSLTSIEEPRLKQVMRAIRQTVPLGFKHHKKPQPHDFMPAVQTGSLDSLPIVRSEYDNARTQVGTLGGGNHFIEIQRGTDGAIWFMVHSGSRNLGFRVANHYNKIAVSLNKRWKVPIPPSWQLAHLPMDDDPGHTYYREMRYCVDFAEANRALMQARVQEALVEEVSAYIEFGEPVNIAHNYAALESHFGKKVYVHRKGATRAMTKDTGIIPGSQGNQSYIVGGKSNPESFSSCSHGAGRKMGRKQAQRQLDLGREKAQLEKKNILHSLRGKKDLDEAPGAYKNIETVMHRQRDLVDIIDVLEPLAVIKG